MANANELNPACLSILSDRQKSYLAGGFLAILVIISSIPFLCSFVPYGHDVDFHMLRIEGIAQALAEGQFPIRIQYSQVQGYGYPVSLMYGDVFLYFPAFLVCFGVPVTRAYCVFAILVNIATVLISYYALSKTFSSRRIGLFASCLWTLSPYRMLDLYLRASVGEYLALTFMPLLVWGIVGIFKRGDIIRANKAWLAVPIAFSAIVYSHVISTFLVLLAMIPVIIGGLIYNHRANAIKRLLLAAVCSLFLSLAFVVPFFDFYTHEDLMVKSIPTSETYQKFLESLVQPAQLLMFNPPMTGYSAPINVGVAADMPFNIGWPLIGCMVLCVISLVLCDEECKKKTVMKVGIACLILCLLIYCAATSLFPWDRMPPNSFLGKAASILYKIQFGWRLLGIGNLFCLISGCCSIFLLRNRYREIRDAAISVLIVIACVCSGMSTTTYLESVSFVPYFALSLSNGVGDGEYLSMPLDMERDGEVHVGEGSSIANFEKKGTRFSFEYTSGSEETNVVLPLAYYGNYEIVSDESLKPTAFLGKTNEGLLEVHLPDNSQGLIEIDFVIPVLWTIALFVSYATLFAIILIEVASLFSWKRRTNLMQ